MTDFCCTLFEALLHILDHGKLWTAKIDGKNHFSGDHISRIRIHINMSSSPHSMRLMAPCDFINQIKHPRHTKACIFAHWHRGRACVRVFSSDCDLCPAKPLTMGDNTNINVFCFQNGALLYVQFKKGMHFTSAHFFFAAPPDAFKLIAK